MNAQVANLRTLVLNADMQPVSWAPLSIWSWQDALVALIKGRVYPVANYEDVEVRSASRSFQVPSVVALKDYHRRKTIAFTRYHVFLRDEFTCQYCGTEIDDQGSDVRSRRAAVQRRPDRLVQYRGLLPDGQSEKSRPDAQAGWPETEKKAFRAHAHTSLT